MAIFQNSGGERNFNEKVKDFNIRSKESGSRLSAKESMDLMNEQMNLMIGAMKFC